MRIGLMSELGRVITASGVKPIASEQWKRENFWVYGAVDPVAGWQFTQEYPHLNGAHFQSFVDALSEALGDERAILQMDQAKAHQGLTLKWPENIVPLFQPAYSPELNPIERFWQHTRRWFKNKRFLSLNELRQVLWPNLAKLTSEEISSLTSYDFILEALFYAAL